MHAVQALTFLWSFAMEAATAYINCRPLQRDPSKLTRFFERFWGKFPKCERLRAWLIAAWIHIPKNHRLDKASAHARLAMLLDFERVRLHSRCLFVVFAFTHVTCSAFPPKMALEHRTNKAGNSPFLPKYACTWVGCDNSQVSTLPQGLRPLEQAHQQRHSK